jgi:glycosyltransferase involved in cell wall biosynthesis
LKILFVANEIPFPPDNGVRIPIYHAMRLMGQAGHRVALAVLTAETDEVEERFKTITTKFCSGGSFLERMPKRHPLEIQLTAILGQRLLYTERYRSDLFRRRLADSIGEFQPDVIHFDLIPMAQYQDVAPFGVGTVASINDSYALTLENALRAGYFRGFEYVYKKWQYHSTRNYEGTVYAKFHQVHVMSEIDKAYLLQLNHNLSVSVIPNGAEDSLFDIPPSKHQNSDIIFVATLTGSHLKCLERFLGLSWPIIRSHHPDVRLFVVGKVGSDAGRLKEEYRTCPEVTFTGYVPNLSDVYRMCGIAIAPVDQNCGLVNKVIEAMAAGLAVVGFENTFAGIPHGKPGVHFVQTIDYESMGHAIAKLIANETRCQELRVAGRELARMYYSWPSRGASYHQMYSTAAAEANRLLLASAL